MLFKQIITKIKNIRLTDTEWNISDADRVRNLLMALVLTAAAVAIAANQFPQRSHVYLPLQDARVVFM